MTRKSITRYPKKGRGHKWTALELKAVPLTWDGDRLNDGDGLVGEVRATAAGHASVNFRFAFKWQSKVQRHYCGTWPATSLEAIRSARDRARSLVKTGVNPNDHRQAERIEAQAKVEATIAEAARRESSNLPFRAMFEAWLADGVARADGNAELRRTFGRDVLPAIGEVPLRNVTADALLGVLRAVGRQRGRGRTAERMLSEVRQMYRWAIKRQPWRALLPDGNPAELVETAQVVPSDYRPGVRDRTLSADELRELRDILATMQADYDDATDRRTAERPLQREAQVALWLCLATACRIGELLLARWEHVNLHTGEWFVPGANTKTGVDWRVYLSAFALKQFAALRELTGASEWCFPARSGEGPVCAKSVSKQFGDRQIRFKSRKPLAHRRHDDSLVLTGGANGEWTPHDLRRTAATMMQALGVTPDVIDRCQNHVMQGSKVRRHYLHHDYAKEKREAWALLGERIEAILAARNVVPLRELAA